MFKTIKEFFLGKPVSVDNVIAPGGAPYKVPEPEATTPILLVTETASAEKSASAYTETYKVEDDHPGAIRRVPESVLEINVEDVTATAPAVETKVKEKAPAKAKATKLTVVKSEKAPAKPKAPPKKKLN
jgi:hypothetical protein